MYEMDEQKAKILYEKLIKDGYHCYIRKIATTHDGKEYYEVVVKGD